MEIYAGTKPQTAREPIPKGFVDAHQATHFHQFDLFSGGQKTGGQPSVLLRGAYPGAVYMRDALQTRTIDKQQTERR
jgi:hypothetical protein